MRSGIISGHHVASQFLPWWDAYDLHRGVPEIISVQDLFLAFASCDLLQSQIARFLACRPMVPIAIFHPVFRHSGKIVRRY
jgi:hypothetical protein